MDDQESMKDQACVLRLNLQCGCEGCMQKVNKKLRKIKGVRKVLVDAEQGKVTVWGLVDPLNLIQHLEKAGKHAELWGGKTVPIPSMNSQLKSGEGHHEWNKGKKDAGLLGKARKSVKFTLPRDEKDGGFHQELRQQFNAPRSPVNGYIKGMGHDGGHGKKHSVINMLLKGLMLKAGVRTGNQLESSHSHGDRGDGGKKSGGSVVGEEKNRAIHGKSKGKGKSKSKSSNSNGRGRTDEGFGWSRKVEENSEQVPKWEESKLQESDEINVIDKEVVANRAALMGKKGISQAPETAMTGDDFHYQLARQGKPYSQQDMAHMMMMAANQQRERMLAMNHGQPLATDQYTHIFSDENTGSCTIM